jgi:UDP-N-acetylglucosamine 4,6-dehydratase/5-epimerase
MFNGKSIFISGGTGSFGRVLTKTLLKEYDPARLIIFSRDEQKHFEMSQQFDPADHPCLRYFIGDVRDFDRLDIALRDVDYIIHAAAQKHVPLAEYNPFECIHTNVMGAENIVRAAIRNNVKKVIALSTDKAANPINLYGASKLAADKICVAANNLSGSDGPRFSVVRYGNVMGSNGSVIPFFRRLIEKGATSLPITDPRMTRFWITLQRSVDFVLSSFEHMNGGEIFVPKIPSMKVTDLATAIAPNLPQETIGIRPGEKLHEVMITEDDSRNTVDMEDRYVILPDSVYWTKNLPPIPNARPVPEGFRYASETNDQWLSGEDIAVLIRKLDT